MCLVTKLGFKQRFVPVPLLAKINTGPLKCTEQWQRVWSETGFFAVGPQLALLGLAC